jgi:tetratricopeptide (TPR) repeat protein
MLDVDLHKTVFLSYRREPSQYLALLMFKELTTRGYDVFWDVETIGAGKFEDIILKNIAARAHFVVLLTDNTLERCIKRGDWLKREIEYAMKLGRKIIPVMVDGFEFKNSKSYLKGKLRQLPAYNGMPLYYQFFDAGIDKLCTQYMTNTEYGQIVPLTAAIRDESLHIIEEAIKSPLPTNEELSAEQWFVRGLGKHKEGILERAIADYSEALRINPKYVVAYNNRGVAWAALLDIDRAISDFTEALHINPNSAALNNRGNARRLKGDLDGAIEDYTEAIKLNPDDADAFFNRSIVYDQKGNLNETLLNLNAAVRINPSSPVFYYNRANKHLEIGDLDEADNDYSEAIRLNPKYIDAYNNRGTLRSRKKDYRGAMDDMTVAIQLNPLDADLYINRGTTRRLARDLEGAIADYSEALRFQSNNADAFYKRAIARTDIGDINGGITDLTTAISLKPNQDYYYGDRGIIRLKAGDLDGAVIDYNKAILLNPIEEQVYINRGEVFFIQKKYKQAYADFQKAIELKPGVHFALAGLAITNHVLGNIDEAQRLWNGLLAQDERYKDAKWVGKELDWAEPLVEAARKLISELD